MKAKALGRLLILAAAGLITAVPVHAAPLPSAAEAADTPVIVGEDGADDLLIRRERYFYSSFARRDPFGSLIKGSFAASMTGDLLDIGELNLVGVVWGEDDKFAMVQDQRKHVHVLRQGDRVVNGKVIRLTRDSLTVQHYFFGETANVTIQLQGEGENETR